MKNPQIEQYESDLKLLKKEERELLKVKKVLKNHHDGSVKPLREVKKLQEVQFKINVTKRELQKLYAAAKEKKEKNAIQGKVKVRNEKAIVDKQIKSTQNRKYIPTFVRQRSKKQAQA